MPLTYRIKSQFPLLLSILVASMLFTYFPVAAQQKPDSASKNTNIIILGNEMGEYIQKDSNNTVHKLLWDVKLLHGSDTLYCDSAFFYKNKNSVEAYGDVVVRQADGTEAFAEYMRYQGNTKVVYMKGTATKEVQLSDGKNSSLWSKEIEYNLNTKTGKYKNGGFLQTEATYLTSNTGTYNLKSKDARFQGNVDVSDPDYHAVSTDLGYNTDTRVAVFFGPSVVTNDKSVLHTSNGVYDTRNRVAHFVDRSSIFNDAQYIEGDTLDYNRNSGFGRARGNVIVIDTTQKSTLYCGEAHYNEIQKTLLAFHNPLMKTINGKDSLFIKADTFFSEPASLQEHKMTAQDSLERTVGEIQSAIEKDSTGMEMVDSLGFPLDSTAVKTDSLAVHAKDTIKQQVPVDSATAKKIKDTLTTGAHPQPARDTAFTQMEELPFTYAPPEPEDSTAVQKMPADSAAAKSMKNKMDALVYGRNKEKRTISTTADTLHVEENSMAARSRMDSATQAYNNRPQQRDTAGPRYFVGYHHVLIFSDSLQGKCDSIRYSQVDSVLRMFKDPVLWPQKSQLKGDVIYMQMDSGKLKEIYVPRNAIMVSRSGPEQAGMFDQIQGNAIKGFLRNNKMDSLIAWPNASSIYFITQDDGAYVGSSEAKSEKIEVLFDNDKIKRIYYRTDVTQTTTPMKDVTPSQLRLSRFLWREKERPQTLEAFLDGVSLPHEPELFGQPDNMPEEQAESGTGKKDTKGKDKKKKDSKAKEEEKQDTISAPGKRNTMQMEEAKPTAPESKQDKFNNRNKQQQQDTTKK